MSHEHTILVHSQYRRLLDKYANIDTKNPIELERAAAAYLKDLQILLQGHSVNLAVDVHQKIIFVSQSNRVADFVLPGLAISFILHSLMRAEDPNSQTNNITLLQTLGWILVILTALKTFTKDKLAVLFDITNHIHTDEGSITKILLRTSIRESIEQIIALQQAPHMDKPRSIYTLGYLHHFLAFCYQGLAQDEIVQTAKDQQFKFANASMQKASEFFTALSKRDISLGEACTFQLDLVTTYFDAVASKHLNTLRQRKIFQDYRNGIDRAKQQVVELMLNTLKQLEKKINVDELNKLTPEDLLRHIIENTHAKDAVIQYTEIASDPIEITDLIFNPRTTLLGHSYELKTIKKWISEGHRTDPITNKIIDPLGIINSAFENLIDYLALGGTLQEFPGFINPVTDKPYVQPILRFSGHTIEATKEGLGLMPENIVFKQLIEKFAPKPKME